MANAPAPDDFPVITPPSVRPAQTPTGALWTDFAEEVKPLAAAPRLREPVAAAPPGEPNLPPAPNLTAAPMPTVPAAAPIALPVALTAALKAAVRIAPKSAAPAAPKTAVPATPKTAVPAAPTAKTATPQRTLFKARRVSPWIAAALGVVVLSEAGFIAALLMREPAAPVAKSPGGTGSSTPVVDTRVPAAPVVQEAALVVAAPTQPQPQPQKPGTDPIAQAASNQRSGGVKLVTPIELKVLEGDKVYGSTADGAIVASAGTHQLDLSNAALGFRTRMAVTFRPGQIVSVNVTIPMGKVNLNAQPWGEAFIDGRSVGDTPLANVNVPLGEHEVVFRHPNLGERRQTITVRADTPTRVSATFDK
jgi:hypothetical protein